MKVIMVTKKLRHPLFATMTKQIFRHSMCLKLGDENIFRHLMCLKNRLIYTLVMKNILMQKIVT